jgi:hypothetical protein
MVELERRAGMALVLMRAVECVKHADIDVFTSGMDALGNAFVSVALNSPEGGWICRRADWLISLCVSRLGTEWQSVVPVCAAVLLLAKRCSLNVSSDRTVIQECIQSFTSRS